MLSAERILESLKKVSVDQGEDFIFLMGIEYEFFVFGIDGEFIDLGSLENEKVLERLNTRAIDGVRCFDLEVGKNMLEIVFEPAKSLAEFEIMLRRAFLLLARDSVAKNWRFVFSDNPVFPGVIKKIPLFNKLNEMNGEVAAEQLSTYASFQINFGMKKVGGVFSNGAKKILYVLNNLAPVLAIYFEWLTNVESNRLSEVFKGFKTGKERLPRPLSRKYVNNLEANLLKIPYIVKPDKSNLFSDAMSSPVKNLTNFHCKMIWWFVRVNGIDNIKEERIETRFLNTFSPYKSFEVIKRMNKIVEIISKNDLSFFKLVNDNDWWAFRRGDKRSPIEVMKIINDNFKF